MVIVNITVLPPVNGLEVPSPKANAPVKAYKKWSRHSSNRIGLNKEALTKQTSRAAKALSICRSSLMMLRAWAHGPILYIHVYTCTYIYKHMYLYVSVHRPNLTGGMQIMYAFLPEWHPRPALFPPRSFERSELGSPRALFRAQALKETL